MSLEIGGFVQGFSVTDVLAPVNSEHICRLCGGCDLEFLGYSRMRVSDGSGEIDLLRCARCDGSGIEPKVLIWEGTWYKPWSWLRFRRDWKNV